MHDSAWCNEAPVMHQDMVEGRFSHVPAKAAPLRCQRSESNQSQPPAVARLASMQFSMTVMSFGMSGLQSVHVRA